MEPTIPAGSIVSVNTAERDAADNVGRVVAIALADGTATLKRLRRTQRGRFVGDPDNRDRAETSVVMESGDRIIGRVQTVHAWLG